MFVIEQPGQTRTLDTLERESVERDDVGHINRRTYCWNNTLRTWSVTSIGRLVPGGCQLEGSK